MSCDQAAQGTEQALESCFSGVQQPPVAAPWAAAPYTENLFLFRAPTGCLCLAAGIRYLAGSIEHRQGGVGRHDGGERGVRGWLSRMASAVSHPVTDWPGFPVTTLVLIPPLCGLRHGAVGPGRCVQPTLLMAQDSFNAWPSQNKAIRAP